MPNDPPALLPAGDNSVTLHERLGAIALEPFEPEPPAWRAGATPLLFSAYAWAKLCHLRDAHGAASEITVQGVCPDPAQPLRVTDLIMPNQRCSPVCASPDTDDLAERADAYAQDHELRTGEVMHPYQTRAIWIHTHPGDSPEPSNTDRRTFADKQPDLFAVMAIVAMDGATHAQLKVAGVGTTVRLPVEHEAPAFEPTDIQKAAWDAIHAERVELTDREYGDDKQGGFTDDPVVAGSGGGVSPYGLSAWYADADDGDDDAYLHAYACTGSTYTGGAYAGDPGLVLDDHRTDELYDLIEEAMTEVDRVADDRDLTGDHRMTLRYASAGLNAALNLICAAQAGVAQDEATGTLADGSVYDIDDLVDESFDAYGG